MKYISTRGSKKKKLFTEILLDGLAEDGGLYLPEKYPEFTEKDLGKWKKLSYAELAFEIFKKFELDVPDKNLKEICEKSYNVNVFKYSREKSLNKKITPVIKLEENLFLQELSNGSTLAFKDMAMQFLGNIFEYVLAKKKLSLNILGATSGDTGSAAEYALRGKKRINVFMLSPFGKMSAFQRAQMYTLEDKNIFNIAVNGLFDDAQDVVKEVSLDAKFKKKYSIGAVNSINWARVLAQVVYYVKGYLEVAENNFEKVSFVVPTGNFGNICAGHVARMCGLPIAKLILATNENNVLEEFFKTGVYRPRKSSETFITSSPSMDISKASNFERFVFDLFGRNGKVTKELFDKLKKDGSFDISSTKEFNEIKNNFAIETSSSTHADRLKTIKFAKDKYQVFIDTHTADAMKVALEMRDRKTKTIILETAQAIKFQEVVEEACGKKVPMQKEFAELQNKIQKIYISDPNSEIIKNFIKTNVV